MDFQRAIINASPLLLQGMLYTVVSALVSICIGLVIGFFTCLMAISKSKPLRFISGLYVWIIRGTPMLVQALLIYFGMPQLIQLMIPGFRIEVLTASIITLSLNSGAYISEIFRSGISAVPKGQIEAARSLGLSKARTMLKITLPQAIKIAIPPMVSQFIITIKDTSILSVIGLSEIVNKAKVYVGKTFQYFEVYLLVAVCYLIITSILMVVAKKLEKKLNYESKSNS
jgi:His/Glu/Gln/Arg/opine family amino acid ABC transporter permease subunit